MKENLNFKVVKKVRKEKGLSRIQLSKLSGIPLTTLHDLEEGITINPRILTLFALAAAFQLDISEFIALLQEEKINGTGKTYQA